MLLLAHVLEIRSLGGPAFFEARFRLGQAEKAIGLYEQALAIHRETGDRRGEGAVLGNLGLAYALLGQVEKAVGLLRQALQIGQEIEDSRIVQIVSQRLKELGEP